jgi:hypothetical protein
MNEYTFPCTPSQRYQRKSAGANAASRLFMKLTPDLLPSVVELGITDLILMFRFRSPSKKLAWVLPRALLRAWDRL